MRFEDSRSGQRRRCCRLVVAVAWLAVCSVVLLPAGAEAGSLEIPAWSFVRGNVRINADPGGLADAGPVVVGGPEEPWGWSVEYDVDVPVDGTYTLQICYAAAEARPVEVFFGGDRVAKGCIGVTFAAVSSKRAGELTGNSSGAKWECVRKDSNQPVSLPLEKGTNTVMFTRRGPLPHLVALRLDTDEEFPADWKPPKYAVRDLDAVPVAHRAAFQSGGVSDAVRRLPIEHITETRPAGSLEIPVWTFDRGNVEIFASPDRYANAGVLIGGGPEAPGEGVVEYDIDFPADGEYTLHARYAAAEARPVDVFFDGENLGKFCTAVSFGSAPFEHPVRLTFNSSGALKRWEALRRNGKPLAISATKGKHTLRFSRRGPLPHLMALRLDSPAAFPEGWTQPQRGVPHIDRVPAAQRTAFIPLDAVNVAALRLAIQDMRTAYGSQYPDAEQYLKQLAALEEKQHAAEEGTEEQQQEVDDALKALRRTVMLDHPALRFDKLLFLKRSIGGYSHTYTDQHAFSAGGNLCVLSPVAPDGKVTPLVPELDGGLFDRFDLSFDGKRVVFGYKKEQSGGFRIYEIEIDPVAGRAVPGSLRQLTFSCEAEAEAIRCHAWQGRGAQRGFDDMDPCYLPDGRIIFVSTRSMRNSFCGNSSVTTLYIMDADGGNVRCISAGPINELAPAVLDDGRVIYTRWEYVDKGLGNGESLWAIRPDGSGSDHVFKNNTVRPAGMSAARSIPGSRKIVAAGGTHHNSAVGPVVLVDARRSRRGTDAMTSLTPELGYPCMWHATVKFGFFMDPFPFSEKLFLVSHTPNTHPNIAKGWGIYVLDAWGNRAELYRDPETCCFEPIPLRPRRKPPVVAPVIAPVVADDNAPAPTDNDMTVTVADTTHEEQTGTLFIQDIYQGMTGIERGRVKYIRVMGALPWPWGQRGMKLVGLYADSHRKKVYGIVKVHEDGSAHFTVPANENVFFHALDENFMTLQQMPTFINLMPGERRSCIGCHELRRQAPGLDSGRPIAMDHPPEVLVPQPGETGPRMIDYAADVQPILDTHCVGCHGAENPEARLDLTGHPTDTYSRSYENFIKRGLVAYADCRYGRSNFRAVPPLTNGSHRSKLAAQIRRTPCGANLSRGEFVRIVTWIDANVPYYGTYRGERNLQDKDHPDFRALPLVGK